MNRAQVGILEKTHQVCLGSLLKGENSSRLESKVRLEILGNLTDETLERSFANEEVGGLLVFTNLSQRNGTRTVTMRLLHSSGGRCGLAGSLCCELQDSLFKVHCVIEGKSRGKVVRNGDE